MKKPFLALVAVILISFGIILYRVNLSFPIEGKAEVSKEVIEIEPKEIFPGDPVMITVNSDIPAKSITYDGKRVPLVLYNGKLRGLQAIDFNERNLEHTARATLADGKVISKKITITPREKIEKPLGIPEKLGGNTPKAAQTLVSNLSKENEILNSVQSGKNQLWKEAFQFPLSKVFVTDAYGYDRATVGQTILHKGTDFRASTGTPVMAMNDGMIKIARTFTVYGNSIIVDHGKGILTLYMHLSKINVKEGERVKQGQVIGESGMTGYAEAPHLHVSVRVQGISVDPMTFMGFFEKKD